MRGGVRFVASEDMKSHDNDNGDGAGRDPGAEAVRDNTEADRAEDDGGTGEGPAAEGTEAVAETAEGPAADRTGTETAEGPGAEEVRGNEDAPADQGTGDPYAAEDRIVELAAEKDRLRDQHLRLAADFDNYRKRTEDRLRQRSDRAQADLVSRLLDPLDDLLRVTALEPENKSSVDSIVEGVDLVERKFFRVLGDAGVEVVDPEGEPFDPNTMEAMMRVPTEAEEDDDTVAMVFQRGYTLRGVLIRPARVSVFKSE